MSDRALQHFFYHKFRMLSRVKVKFDIRAILIDKRTVNCNIQELYCRLSFLFFLLKTSLINKFLSVRELCGMLQVYAWITEGLHRNFKKIGNRKANKSF